MSLHKNRRKDGLSKPPKTADDGTAGTLKPKLSKISGRGAPEGAAGAVLARRRGSASNGTESLADLVRRYPQVELATPVDAPPEGDRWLHEIKFDGYRLVAFLADGELQLRTRNGNNWTLKFPTLRASLAALRAGSAVLDMEAVVLDAAGKTSFQALQHALAGRHDRQAIRAYVFDLLYLDGQDLTPLPLVKRKEKLKALLAASPAADFLHYSEHFTGRGAEVAAKSCAMGLEGIVSKRIESPYRPGRQAAWLKLKCIKRQEFVIIGYTAARAGNRAIGALHLGYHDHGQLRYAGKVGTGFSMADAQTLYGKLLKLETQNPPVGKLPRNRIPGAHWVRPSLLCEVAFTEWTDEGLIRHPTFEGLREDKPAREVYREKPAPGRNARRIRAPETGPLEVSGVAISHPDRVIFRDTGLTKGRLAEYYAAMSRWILKDLKGHPISLLRCPEGISGQCFFQRSPAPGMGADVHPFPWKHKGKSYEYLYVENERGLIQLIQMGTIELHPWGSSVARIDCPDRIIFDLDPDESVPFEAVKLAALDLRRRLAARGLRAFPKCTGGKGLHVTASIRPAYPWDQVKAFCATLAGEMVRDVPSAYTATMSKSKRAGKIFVDTFRNDHTATAIADYSVRARPGASVAVPLEWHELGKLKSASQFKIEDVLKRTRNKQPDPARDLPQTIRASLLDSSRAVRPGS